MFITRCNILTYLQHFNFANVPQGPLKDKVTYLLPTVECNGLVTSLQTLINLSLDNNEIHMACVYSLQTFLSNSNI